MTLASMLGLFVFSILSILISMSIIGAIISASEATTTVAPNSVFTLVLKGSLVERSEKNSLSAIMGTLDKSRAELGLDELLQAIDKAQKTDNIKGLYLDVESFEASPAAIKELRQALLSFKESGKFIVAYADSYTNGTYHLASVADKVTMNPHGMMGVMGLTMNTVFFKDALEKLGIEMQVFKVGTFKSAVEPFVNRQMSDANRLQLTQLSTSIWNDMLSDIAASRHIKVEEINQFANQGLFMSEPEKAVEFGLVDTLIYENAIDSLLQAYVGADYQQVKLKAMKNVDLKEAYSADKVAVVYAVGNIDDNSDQNLDSKKITETLLDLADNDNVKAVVLRINSPGGSAYGSEQMWHATSILKAKKPLIVSMGAYAASGGYYIASAADTIVAEPSTITGSIGIFGMLPNVKELTQKLGLAFDGVKTNELSDFGMVTRPTTMVEKTLFQNYVNRGYELFVKRCADGRGMTTDQIKAIAEGRVWTGVDAQKIGLVDVLGGLDVAVKIAAEKANLGTYNISQYPAKKDVFTELMDDLSVSMETRILKSQLGDNYKYFNQLKMIQGLQGAQAMMPFVLNVE